jgi:ABC-type Na+ efflux pump permease subunit
VVTYATEYENIIQGSGSYVEFIISGLLMMAMITSVRTGLPRAIAYERDVGTLNGFLVAPISRILIIAGKVLGMS